MPWVMFLMEMADAPRYVRRRPAPVVDSSEQAATLLGARAKIMIKK